VDGVSGTQRNGTSESAKNLRRYAGGVTRRLKLKKENLEGKNFEGELRQGGKAIKNVRRPGIPSQGKGGQTPRRQVHAWTEERKGHLPCARGEGKSRRAGVDEKGSGYGKERGEP